MRCPDVCLISTRCPSTKSLDEGLWQTGLACSRGSTDAKTVSFVLFTVPKAACAQRLLELIDKPLPRKRLSRQYKERAVTIRRSRSSSV